MHLYERRGKQFLIGVDYGKRLIHDSDAAYSPRPKLNIKPTSYRLNGFFQDWTIPFCTDVKSVCEALIGMAFLEGAKEEPELSNLAYKVARAQLAQDPNARVRYLRTHRYDGDDYELILTRPGPKFVLYDDKGITLNVPCSERVNVRVDPKRGIFLNADFMTRYSEPNAKIIFNPREYKKAATLLNNGISYDLLSWFATPVLRDDGICLFTDRISEPDKAAEVVTDLRVFWARINEVKLQCGSEEELFIEYEEQAAALDRLRQDIDVEFSDFYGKKRRRRLTQLLGPGDVLL
ncbi:hypothetical protein HY612_05850 [Candidatus Roizmanbacteria bacterium]|nr:hypothetical protein [Candidatus Roizmanbacteria bacterium]